MFLLRRRVGAPLPVRAGPDGKGPRATPNVARVDVLGVPVTATTFVAALDVVSSWIETGQRSYATFTGVHGVMECRRSEAVLAAHRGAGLVACDGMPLVWSGRWAGIKTTERVYGPDFLLAFSERARDRGWRSFYFGGAPGVPERLAARLAGRFPGLVTAGSFSPPFGRRLEDESDEAIQLINASQPDIVWVGLSTPKQELWMAHHRERLEASALLGVGAAFDIHTGRVPQAPRWMQRSGLEWVFRLGVEPRRLASRYLRNNPQFISAIIQNPPRHLTEEAG